jgi:hypothetical protein
MCWVSGLVDRWVAYLRHHKEDRHEAKVRNRGKDDGTRSEKAKRLGLGVVGMWGWCWYASPSPTNATLFNVLTCVQPGSDLPIRSPVL